MDESGPPKALVAVCDFCRLLGQEALKASFRKNSGTIVKILFE